MFLAGLDSVDGKIDHIGTVGVLTQYRSGVLVADVGYCAAQALQRLADGYGPRRPVGLRLPGHHDIEAGDDYHAARMIDDELGSLRAVVVGKMRPQGQHSPLVLRQDDIFDTFVQIVSPDR